MKSKFLLFALLIANFVSFAQSTRVAILDFENISGIAKYDGLGKAMSSMLISDIEANVSPKRLQLVERAQIQKVLKEQNFQANGKVNKNTAVQTGKLLGVNYLLVGDVYILNDQLIINARLTNTETGDIVFSKKQEGKIVSWLNFKTNIAKEISSKLSLPIDSKILNSNSISEKSLLLFAKGINYLDKYEIDSASIVLTELKYTEKEFHYTDAQLEQLFEQSTKQNSNISLKQKAYILNLHKRISRNPIEAWQQIETFWNGPLDDKYPYLEYIFFKNLYDKFKNDSAWINYSVLRQGVNTKLGDMLLYSISNHASHSDEINTAIRYNKIRDKLFPMSDISIFWGEPIDPSKYRWELLDEPNKDTIYFNYLMTAQEAYIFGLGSRNEKIMKEYLMSLKTLLDKPFYDYIPSEYYYELEDKKIPIFNPYDVLGTLIVLIGDETIKTKAKKFYNLYAEKKIYTGLLSEQPWFNGEIKYDMLLKNSSVWNSSSFDDYKSKNWTKEDFSNSIIAKLYLITIDAIVLQTLNKFTESYELLNNLNSLAKNNISVWHESIWQGLSVQQIYLIVQLRNVVSLGKMEDTKYISRQLSLLGIEPQKYLSLHTELID